MKYLMLLLVTGLALTRASAVPDTAWHSALAAMGERMSAVQYESYDYEATTILPGDSTHIQRGSLYLNRPDTMLYHVIGPVTMLVSAQRFLRRDDEQRMISSATFSGENQRKREALTGAFFNIGESMDLLQRSFAQARLLELRRDAAETLIRLEVTDSVTYSSVATLILDAQTSLLREIRYEVTRHTEFRKPTPETDYRQIVRCHNYRWNRDPVAEHRLQESAAAIQKQIAANTYKVTQL